MPPSSGKKRINREETRKIVPSLDHCQGQTCSPQAFEQVSSLASTSVQLRKATMRTAKKSTMIYLHIESCFFHTYIYTYLSTNLHTIFPNLQSSTLTFEDIFLFTVVVATKFEATSLGDTELAGAPCNGLPHPPNPTVRASPADSKVSGNVTPAMLEMNLKNLQFTNFNWFNLPGLVHLFIPSFHRPRTTSSTGSL